MSKYALGIDIGGTKILLLLTDNDGKQVASCKVPSHVAGMDTLSNLLHQAKEFLRTSEVESKDLMGIGLGLPGIIDAQTEVVIRAPAVEWENLDVKRRLEQEFGVPACLDNDVNMAAIGEMWAGTARGHRHLVFVAIGTGLGAGLVLDGKIYRGHNGGAGEIGHFRIDPLVDNPHNINGYGPLEQHASGTGIKWQAERLLNEYPESLLHHRDINAQSVFQAAAENDALAIRVVNETVQYVSFGLMNIKALLDPSLVVIGGGMSQAPDGFFEEIRKRVDVDIVLSSLGEEAGAYGAAGTVILRQNT